MTDNDQPSKTESSAKDSAQAIFANPEIMVFDERGMDDKSQTQSFYTNIVDLRIVKGRGFLGTGNWDKEIQSFKVIAGHWQFCEGYHLTKPWPALLKPGDAGNLPDFGIPFGDGMQGPSSIILVE